MICLLQPRRCPRDIFWHRIHYSHFCQSFLPMFLVPSVGILSKPTQVSPFYMFYNSSKISSSVTPWPFAIFQNFLNSSSDIYPSPSKSTWLKNSRAESFPKELFQCLRASSRSISALPSLSKTLNVLSTSSKASADNSCKKKQNMVNCTWNWQINVWNHMKRVISCWMGTFHIALLGHIFKFACYVWHDWTALW